MFKNFLNPEGHQNPISGSKVMVILLKEWILPIGGVASGRVRACSMRISFFFICEEEISTKSIIKKTKHKKNYAAY